MPDKGLYSFAVKTIDGQDRPIADYRGKVLLIVNVASYCGYTPQYEGLEKIYKKYKSKGLRILAFPANEFAKEEPGTDPEIKEFCRSNYHVSFDLFSKIVAKGKPIHPLYQYLTTQTDFKGEIRWNFDKFLADRKGDVAARFEPATEPDDPQLTGKIEELLGS